MTYKNKLIDLLKSDDETKTAMEKLEFGIKLEYENFKCTFLNKTDFWDYRVIKSKWLISFDSIIKKDDDFKIIWLPLQERFIRMYCENKKEIISMYKNELQFYRNFKSITLDNNLDFDQQDDEVYKKIYEALNNLIK